MELNDWAGIVAICAVFSGIFCLFSGLMMSYVRDYRITKLEDAVESIRMGENSARGNAKRAEKAERMQQAMVEAASIMKNDEIKDKQAAVLNLALKYPDIAMDLVKKGI